MIWPVQCWGWDTSCFLLSLNSNNLFIYPADHREMWWNELLLWDLQCDIKILAMLRKEKLPQRQLLSLSSLWKSELGVASLCQTRGSAMRAALHQEHDTGASFPKGVKHQDLASFASFLFNSIWTDVLVLRDCVGYNQFCELALPSLLKDSFEWILRNAYFIK